MRIRIAKTPKGYAVDGIRVDLFHEGLVYELPSSLACLLITEGWAEPLLDVTEPITRDRFSQRVNKNALSEAADRGRRGD